MHKLISCLLLAGILSFPFSISACDISWVDFDSIAKHFNTKVPDGIPEDQEVPVKVRCESLKLSFDGSDPLETVGKMAYFMSYTRDIISFDKVRVQNNGLQLYWGRTNKDPVIVLTPIIYTARYIQGYGSGFVVSDPLPGQVPYTVIALQFKAITWW